MLRFGGCSDRGRVRERNEDSFLFDEPLGLAIVADGMGGHRAGEIASQMAIELIYQKLQSCPMVERNANVLREALVQASTQIYECGRKDISKRDMGSTVVALWILDNRALVAHVGDSRAYLCRNGEVRPLTHDHTLVQELVNAGRITPEEAETHRFRNVLSRAMGVADETEADLLEFELESGDRIMLCSDGLYGYTTQDALYQMITTPQDPTEKANALIRLANESGGGDNITAVIAEISNLPKKRYEEYRDEPTLEMNSSAMNAVITAIDLAEAQLKTQELPPIQDVDRGDIKTHEELPALPKTDPDAEAIHTTEPTLTPLGADPAPDAPKEEPAESAAMAQTLRMEPILASPSGEGAEPLPAEAQPQLPSRLPVLPNLGEGAEPEEKTFVDAIEQPLPTSPLTPLPEVEREKLTEKEATKTQQIAPVIDPDEPPTLIDPEK